MYDYRGERWHTAIGAGRIQFGWDEPYVGGPGKWIRWRFVYTKMNGNPRTLYWKFSYGPEAGIGATPLLFIPLWFPALFAAIPTGLLFTRDALARRRLFMQGRCPSCSFDLAGLPHNSPCPECGKKSLNSLNKPIAESAEK